MAKPTKKARSLAQLAASLDTRKRPLPPELQASAAEAKALLKASQGPVARAARSAPSSQAKSASRSPPAGERSAIERFVRELAQSRGYQATPEYVAHTADVLEAWEARRAGRLVDEADDE